MKKNIALLYALRQVIDQAISDHEELERLRPEFEDLSAKYSLLLSDSIRHGETMMGNTLAILLDKGKPWPML